MTRFFLFLCLIPLFLFGSDGLLLKENLKKAQAGDFVVIAQGKSYTLFHIFAVQKNLLTIEEVTIPSSIACDIVKSWKSWIENNAPQNTSWVHYQIDLERNEMKNYYSFTKRGRFIVPDSDNFLATLLNLELYLIPPSQRRKVGNNHKLWEPKMVVNGQIQQGAVFDAYVAEWPKDCTPLSGKSIEIYLPHESTQYPAYFPYWLQTKGVIGQAKVRIVDSGKGLISPLNR